jgi:H+/Cl- antiporter ClcA
MLEQPFDIFHFFLFVIPGFITVWSFRYFTDSKKSRDFEYLVLSIFWGLLMILLYELLSVVTKTQVTKLFQNPYAAAIVLSLLGLLVGWIGSCLSRTRWLQKITHWLKNPRL